MTDKYVIWNSSKKKKKKSNKTLVFYVVTTDYKKRKGKTSNYHKNVLVRQSKTK